MTKDSKSTLQLPRQLVLIIIIRLIGFLSGVLIALLPCDHCEKAVLTLDGYKIFGEHRLYCRLYDK